MTAQIDQAAVARADADGFARAVDLLAEIGRTLSPEPARSLPPAEDPLIQALTILGRAGGFTLRTVVDGDEASTLAERLRRLAHLSGFRMRAVELSGPWWRENGAPLLAFDAETGQPVALLATRLGYERVEPNGSSTRLDARSAGRLKSSAVMLYTALPESVRPGALIRFVLRGLRPDIVGLVIAAIGGSALTLLTPLLFSMAVDVAIPEGRVSLVAELSLMLCAAAVGAALIEAYKSITFMALSSRADLRLQAAVWDRVLRLPSAFFRTWQVGDLASRLLGVDAMRRILSQTLFGAILGGAFSVLNLVVMTIYDPDLALWGALYAVAVSLVLALLTAGQARFTRQSYALRGSVQALIVQVLGAISKIRVAGAERRAFARWAEIFSRQRGVDARAAVLGAGAASIRNIVLPLASLLVFALITTRGDRIDVAAFVGFNVAFGQFLASVIGFYSALAGSLALQPLWQRVQPLIHSPVEPILDREAPGALTGAIALRNVTFRYEPDTPPVLDGLNLDIAAGEFVAITGHSGCGKSTLIRLILGFESPENGNVFFDGRDLARLDVRLVRRQIGTVLQTMGLLPGTLRENIAGPGQYTDGEILHALTLAGLDRDVAKLPMGLETVVTEGASTFSGGQRQRLMIARALIRSPKILLFDEATSALDNETQRIVTEAIRGVQATKIVVAHRLSTLANADRIVVLDRGRVVEEGTYDELLVKDGLFRQLAKRQLI